MRDILTSLVQYEGIHSASVVSLDGMLVASALGDETGAHSAEFSDQETQPVQTMAALASGWLGEIMRSVGPLSWATPYRCLLRATQKNLIIHAFAGSFLLLVTEPEVDPEETRALMDSAVQQLVEHIQASSNAANPPGMVGNHPPGALPSTSHTPLRLATPGDSSAN